MAALLSGLRYTVAGVTINRLCASGLDAVGTAARAISAGEADIIIAGGVESMSRSPLVMEKAHEAFQRNQRIFDTTLGWRFVNPLLEQRYGCDSMMATAENIALEFGINREDQDDFALWSQTKALAAIADGRLGEEITPVPVPAGKQGTVFVDKDEHPRMTSTGKLAALKPLVHERGTVTAGNSSGINDGAAALLIASGAAVSRFGLVPMVRIVGMAVAGVEPRLMGLGPVPATNKLLSRCNVSLDDLGVIELNEAFAVQALGCLRQLGLSDGDARVNPQGGAIALGHPLGMSGARLAVTAAYQLQRSDSRMALCCMCVGVGQGVAMLLARV
jgi:acetyl-CoA acyltransferase